MKLTAKKCKDDIATVVFHKATLSYPLYEKLINKYSKQFVRTRFEARGGGGGGVDVSQEIGAVDLSAICVPVLRSVLE